MARKKGSTLHTKPSTFRTKKMTYLCSCWRLPRKWKSWATYCARGSSRFRTWKSSWASHWTQWAYSLRSTRWSNRRL